MVVQRCVFPALSVIVLPLLIDDASTIRLRRWRRSARPAAAAASMVAVLLWSGAAYAQAPSLAPSPQPAETLRLSRDEAVRLAIENDPDLAVSRFDPAISATRVAQAESAFVPTVTSALLRNSASSPSSNLFTGDSALTTAFWSGEAGLAQRLRWGGASYDVSFTTARTTTNSLITTFSPSITSSIQAIFSQPLLRNFKTDPARAQLELTERNREIADVVLRDRIVRTATGAEAAYWNLVSAVARVDVQQRSLDLALELERTNRARVDVGQSPPLDLVAARAEVAQRRESLIVARTVARQAEDQLRTIVVDPKRADFWTVRLEPGERVPGGGSLPDVDAAVRRALSERADLIQVRKEIQNTETLVSLARNEILPDLRVQATYLANGLGGSRLIRSGGFPGTVTDVERTSFGSVLGQTFSADFPTWTLGLTLSYPIGHSAEEAALARARIERDQAAARLRRAELDVVREVRDAAYRLEQNLQRIETAKLGRELAEQRLDAEQKRFEVGMSTSFLVIQAQRDLAVARNNELQAFLDYQLAVVNFERTQQVGVR